MYQANGWANLPLIVGGLAALAVLTLILGIAREVTFRRASPLDRLQGVPGEAGRRGDGLGRAPAGGRDGAARLGGDPEGGRPIASPVSAAFLARLEGELRQAGLMVAAGEFLLAITVLAALGVLISWWLHNPILGALLLVGALIAPRQWLRGRLARRSRVLEAQLPRLIELLASATRSGKSLPQAIELAGRELPPPMSIELRRVTRNIQILGGGIEEALRLFAAEVGSDNLELIVTTLNVQLAAGGDIAKHLDTIGATIRGRVMLKGEVQALTAQQRISGSVLSLLPVVLALALLAFNPRYITGVFATTQWCGYVMSGVAIVMIVAGMVVMRRSGNIRL